MDNTNDIKQEMKILTYFMIKNNMGSESEYVLYNYEDNKNIIYISGVFHEGDNVKFIKPTVEALPDIKKIIQNLISHSPNGFVFSQNKYQYIDVKKLNDKTIENVDTQKIQLTDIQYDNLLNSKYLMYPYGNLITISKDSKEKNSLLPNKISMIVSSIILIVLFGGLISYQFSFDNIKDGLFNFDYTMTNLLTLTIYINNYLIIKLAVVSLIFSVIFYNTEKEHPIITWIVMTLLLIIIYIIWYKIKGYIEFDKNFIDFIKGLSIFILFISLVFTLAYYVSIGISKLITEKLKLNNFITYYTISFFLFTFTFIGLGLFYNNYLLDHVQEFVLKIL